LFAFHRGLYFPGPAALADSSIAARRDDVALEHFKTQVLLLHSQQSTLDALSAGFGDRYAVHLATSGTEALNTLGETPIHVIISAQDLPGMSGLEALREAKKRSPDTIGILLAGSDQNDGLEALVGDKEVFQIVRGSVTPDSLRELIDAATRRVRMLTLSESANDLAANVDEPVGEHIVMETSEQGSTIITEGSAKLAAFKPRHSQIATNAAGRDIDVLVLTKDEDFLETIRNSSLEMHKVHHANTAAQAAALVQDHKIGVLVTDAAMIGAHIDALTERLRQHQPRLVAVVAGRRDDGELLMDLINRGHVYRFLLKPVSPGRARLAIEASVKYHLEAAESAFKAKPRSGDAVAAAADSPKLAKVSRITPAGGQAQPAERKPVVTPSGGRQKVDERKQPTGPSKQQPRQDRAGRGRARPVLRAVGGFAAALKRSAGKAAKPEGAAKPVREAAAATLRPSAGKGLQPKMLVGGAIVAIAALVAVAGQWLSDVPAPASGTAASGIPAADTDRPAASPSIVEIDLPASVGRLLNQPPAYQELLNEARIARDAGEIVVPPGSNAVELYLAAREMAPQEPLLIAELNETLDAAIALAEAALLENRTAAAAQTLSVVRLADPENSRLPFLDAQLAQLQQRAQLDRARLAIRERRLEDAATALQDAPGSDAESAEFQLLRQELAAARSEQALDEVLALASERLEQNALTTPANDNARYYYELALSNAPENTVARQGLTIVASKLVLRARDAIDVGQLDEAKRLLQNAAALDAKSADLNASLQALQNAEAERDAALQAEAEAERQAELEREARLLAEAAAEQNSGSVEQSALQPDAGAESEAADTGTTAAADEVGEEVAGSAPSADLADSGRDAPAAGTDSAAPEGLYSLASAFEETASAAEDASLSNAPGGPAAAAFAARTDEPFGPEAPRNDASPPASSTPEYVAISSLTRVNYVAPEYPRAAQRRNMTGWVDVTFRVDRSGRVLDVGILDSKPSDVFTDAATEAVSQWRFEPVTEMGVRVEKLVAVRLMFNLE
ncbi:MAG: TonB family protein, partial [Woeseia sp.]